MDNKVIAVRGVALTWIGRIGLMLMAFIATPIIVRGLGATTYGLWSIVMSLYGYFVLADLGVGKACAKFIAQFDAQGDSRSVRITMASGLSMYARLSLGLLLISVIVAMCFPLLFDTGGYAHTTIFCIVVLFGVDASVSLLCGVYVSAVVARKRFHVVNLTLFACQMVASAVFITIVTVGGGILWMAAATLFIDAVGKCFIYAYARHRVGAPAVDWSARDRGFRTTLLKFGSLTALGQLAGRLGSNSGTILTGLILGPAAAAYYSIVETLALKCTEFSDAVGQAVMPVASQFDSQRRHADLVDLLVVPSRILLAMAALFATVLCVFGQPFLELWIGATFAEKGHPVLCVLSAAMLFKLPAIGMQSTLVGMGRVASLSRLATLEAVLIVGLGIVLLRPFELVGMASAIFAGQFLASGLFLPIYACRCLQYPVGRFYARVAAPALISVLPATGVAVLIAVHYPPQSLAGCLGRMGIVALTAVISVFFLCLETSNRAAMLRAFYRGRRHRLDLAADKPGRPL